VGADIAALCQGAAMSALRRRIAEKSQNQNQLQQQKHHHQNAISMIRGVNGDDDSGGGSGGAVDIADALASGLGAMSLGGSGGGGSADNAAASAVSAAVSAAVAAASAGAASAAVITWADFAAARVRIRPSALREVAVVGRCTLTPPDPWLKGAWFQPLHLSSEKPVSKFAFKFNLYRYTVEIPKVDWDDVGGLGGAVVHVDSP
jgi:SpoVK/Ycf46/Vps4 family AAA+-type ATPase